jgi:7-cyano-7-deazaguanine synthase
MPVAVLVSGGVESASLVCILKHYFANIYPLYMRFGLTWEKVEYQYLLRYLEAIKQPGIKPLKVLDMPISNIYGKHWSTSGANVPDATSADEAVYLPGRNLLLVTQTAVWCSLNQVPFIALGSLGTNPFPDASNNFFAQLENTLATGLAFNINILRPFDHMHKEQVIALAKHLPLHLTFSCISPASKGSRGEALAIHCGTCNKCAERQKAFLDAQVADLTTYASSQPKTITVKT